MLGQLLFSHSDNLSRTLQKRDISAAGAQGAISMTLTTLEKIRNDTSFHLFWLKTTKIANELGVGNHNHLASTRHLVGLKQGMHHRNFLADLKSLEYCSKTKFSSSL